jgi:hypothetical protein
MATAAGKSGLHEHEHREEMASVPNWTALTLACAFLASIVSAPWVVRAWQQADRAVLELELRSSLDAVAALYVDQGAGLQAAGKQRAAVVGGDWQRVRFHLPGPVRALRLEAIDRPGRVSIRSAKIRRPSSMPDLSVPPAAWRSIDGILRLEVDGGRVELETQPDAAVGALGLGFATSPTAAASMGERLTAVAPVWIAFFLPTLILAGGAVWQRARLQRVVALAGVRPLATLTCVGTLATVLATYPVVFLGGSWVSPNWAGLLYESSPGVPGLATTVEEDAKGADVGAVMWAHLPAARVQIEAFAEGVAPFWNRYNASGTALLGQGQYFWGDPFHVIVLLAGGESWAWDLRYLLARMLFAVGMAMVAYLSGVRLGSSALIGASAAFVGYYVYRVNHPALFTLGYGPWVLVGWLALVREGGERAFRLRAVAFLFAANAVLLVSGTVKEAVFLFAGLNVVGLGMQLTRPVGLQERLRGAAVAALATLAAVLVTAPSWLVFLETLKLSYTPYLQARAYQIPPGFLIGLFDEIFYRPLQAMERVSNGSANFLFFIGVAYLATNPSVRRPTRPVIACAIGAGCLCLLAFGVVPPALVERLPLIRGISHLDNCATAVLIVLFGPLAGAGLDAARQGVGGPCGLRQIARVAAVVFGTAAVWLGTVQANPKVLPGVAPILPGGSSVVAVSPFVWTSLVILPSFALGALFVLRLTLRKRIPAIVGGLLIAGCLWGVLWRHGLHGTNAADAYVVSPPPRAALFAPSAAIEAIRLDSPEPFRVAGTGGTLTPGWAAVYSIETISGPDALMNLRYRELTDALGMDRFLEWRLILEPQRYFSLRHAYDFLGVRYLLDSGSGRGILEQQAEFVGRWDLDVYRNPRAWPRAFFARDVVPYRTIEELAELVRTRPGPFAALPADSAPPGGTRSVSSQAVSATAYHLGTNRTSFTVEADGPGIAVLHESWVDEGVVAALNGRSVPAFPVNHAFRGVAIPGPGTWRVEFAYRPTMYTHGLKLAAVGLLTVLVAAGLALRFSRPARTG